MREFLEDCAVKEDGFSLIELLIVVAILGIVSAIAVPNFMKARRAAHEANAVRFLKSWVPGQELYKRVHGRYSDTDEDLVRESFISAGLNSNNDADDNAFIYSIDSSSSDDPRWWGTARRKSTMQAARNFYIDQTGVIRYNVSSIATSSDPPLN